MPYACKLVGSSWRLQKQDGSKEFGSHRTKKDCMQQMRAIYSSELSNSKNIVVNDYNVAPYDIDQKIKDSDDEIHVVINGQGGDFFEAISTHQKLRNSGKQVVVHINPLAFSAHAVVALAGDRIYMPENGLMMFHLPKAVPQGPKTAEELEKMAAAVRASEEILVNTLVSKTKKSKEECESIMRNDTWMTAEEAKKAGIVDEIIPIFREVQVQDSYPERIVNFLETKIKENEDMGLQEICTQFGVENESGLVTLIQKLQQNQKPKQPEVSEGVVNMVKQARETMLNSLLENGKITPVVLNELKTEFVTPERIRLDMTNDNTKEFERIVNSFGKNETIINFKGKTGEQIPPEGDGDSKDDDVCSRLAKKMKEKE